MNAATTNGPTRYGRSLIETATFKTAVAKITRTHMIAEAAITPEASGMPTSVSLRLVRANESVTFVDEMIPPSIPAIG
jgi:hypothetical protein